MLEQLEARALLAASPIDEFVGSAVHAPVRSGEPTLGRTWETTAIGDSLYLLGEQANQAAYQPVDFGTVPTVQPVVTLPSLDFVANPATGSQTGQVRGVADVNGAIQFYGWSVSPNASQGFGHSQPEATSWDMAGVPTALGFVNQTIRLSQIAAASPNGIFVGDDVAGAAVGHLGSPLAVLPSAFQGTVACAVSVNASGELIGGWDNDGYTPAAWKGDPNDLSSYHQLTTNYAYATDGGIPDMFWYVAVTADGRDVGAGDYVTNLGATAVGLWDLDTGDFITGLGPGTTIQDMMVVDGETVIAANGADGGFLTTLDYPTDRLRLIDLPGMNALGLSANPEFVHGGVAVDGDGHLIVTGQAADGTLIVGGWTVGESSENPHPWQNPALPQDVDGQDGVTPLDVLTIINYINTNGTGAVPGGVTGPPYFDVDGDDQVTPADVLAVINFINGRVVSVAFAASETPANGAVAPPTMPVSSVEKTPRASGQWNIEVRRTAIVDSPAIPEQQGRPLVSRVHPVPFPSPMATDSLFSEIDGHSRATGNRSRAHFLENVLPSVFRGRSP